jgi:hypothetical protein
MHKDDEGGLPGACCMGAVDFLPFFSVVESAMVAEFSAALSVTKKREGEFRCGDVGGTAEGRGYGYPFVYGYQYRILQDMVRNFFLLRLRLRGRLLVEMRLRFL